MFKLRDYQQRLVDNSLAAADAGRRPIIVAPTGAGKSAVLAELVRQLGQRDQRILAICHRREILNHLVRTITKHSGSRPGVISADSKTKISDINERIIVAMVPTLSKRKHQIPEHWIGDTVLLCDEAHHAVAPSWSGLIDLLQPPTLIGCTATPVSCRSDKSLGDVFDTLLLGPEPEELVAQGFLAPAVVYACPDNQTIDTTGVRSKGGDYVLSDLEKAARRISGETVAVWQAYNPTRAQTLVACCTLLHADELTQRFLDAGVAAASIDGSMPTAKRDGIIQDFSNGVINVLCFVSVIDEGLDIPEAECIVFARPTKSIRLRRQLEGRVRRIHPGKKAALVIDQTDSWQFLPLPNDKVEWTLDANGEQGAVSTRAKNQRVERVEGSGEVRVIELSGAELRRIELRSKTWRETPELIKALRSGPAELRRLTSALRFREKARLGALRSLSAWPASLDDLVQIGDAFGWRNDWALDTFRKQVATQSGRNYLEHAAGEHLLYQLVDDAILAGELAPGAGLRLKFVGLRVAPPEGNTGPVSEMVAAVSHYVAALLNGPQKQEALQKLTNALAPRLEEHGHTLQVLGLELSRAEQGAAVLFG